jgi:hypothetical protein
MAKARFLAAVCLLLFASAAWADGGANHQVRNQHFGVSGGNVNERTRVFCCSGTLGALVIAGTTQYVLSNNHVLARTDQAAAGEDISQPGLIDNGCLVPPIVADFTVAPPLGSNVDAAIAQLRTGTMDPTGFIEDIGTISSVVKAPSVGLAVAKSGRTTGFTTGPIGSINTSVNVQYQKRCGQGRKFIVSYTNQIVVNGSGFSAGGDSGSLVVTNDVVCHQPVGLLYAGSSTSTILNPIGEVLTKLGAQLGTSVSFVGVTCGAAAGTGGFTSMAVSPLELPPQAVDRATAVLQQHLGQLMATPNVIGAGVGASTLNPFEATIIVYVDHTSGPVPDLPLFLDGVSITRFLTDPFVAY